MKIPTKDASGNPNGFLIPIWNALEHPELRPEQVYLTVVAPGARKGPHLHKKRRGLFCCIRGNVKILTRDEFSGHATAFSGEDHEHRLVCVPAGWAAAIYNEGPDEALVLNMPSPAWSAEDPDEWPVEDWLD